MPASTVAAVMEFEGMYSPLVEVVLPVSELLDVIVARVVLSLLLNSMNPFADDLKPALVLIPI